MLVATGYHLCGRCAQKDWERDPVVRTAIARNLSAKEEAKARCADCRSRVRTPHFRLCAWCAERARLCQHCCGTTRTPEEEAFLAKEAEWKASYRAVVRKHGIRSGAAKLHLEGCNDAMIRDRLASTTIRELDPPTKRFT